MDRRSTRRTATRRSLSVVALTTAVALCATAGAQGASYPSGGSTFSGGA
jgi:hypothetical protein